MSQQANITVFDGAATPVSHTFSGVDVLREDAKNSVATYRELNAAKAIQLQARCIIRKKLLPSGVTRVSVRIEVPVEETIASFGGQAGYVMPPAMAYYDATEVVTYVHPRSTEAGVRTTRMMALNIANNVTTSVAAATTGAGPDALDRIILPT